MIERLQEVIENMAEKEDVSFNGDLPLKESFPHLEAEVFEAKVIALAETLINNALGTVGAVELPDELAVQIEHLPFTDWLGLVADFAEGAAEDMHFVQDSDDGFEDPYESE